MTNFLIESLYGFLMTLMLDFHFDHAVTDSLTHIPKSTIWLFHKRVEVLSVKGTEKSIS